MGYVRTRFIVNTFSISEIFVVRVFTLADWMSLEILRRVGGRNGVKIKFRRNFVLP